MTLNFKITGSKSESNRALVLQSFIPELRVQNLSNSDDTQWMQKVLGSIKKNENVYCGHAGTVLRFSLARAVFQPGYKGLVTGSKRLLSRPIQPLIDGLKPLAKSIKLTEDGIFIESLEQLPTKASLSVNVDASSQFLSALCLCAPVFKEGLNIHILGTISSRPYIHMTLKMLASLGFSCVFNERDIRISFPKNGQQLIHEFAIEPDWSSLSYWFSFAAITKQSVHLDYFKENSLQADAKILDFAKNFSLTATFDATGLGFKYNGQAHSKHFFADFDACPDIAPTFMALCAALRIPCTLTGLHSLRVKECDRLDVMQHNLQALGFVVQITSNSFELVNDFTALNNDTSVTLKSDQDHRMVMSMAPLLLLFPNLTFDDTSVVAKSYPNFWEDFEYATNQIKK